MTTQFKLQERKNNFKSIKAFKIIILLIFLLLVNVESGILQFQTITDSNNKHPTPVKGIYTTQDGNKMFSIDQDATIKVWKKINNEFSNVETIQIVGPVINHENMMSISNNGQVIALASYSKVYIYEYDSGSDQYVDKTIQDDSFQSMQSKYIKMNQAGTQILLGTTYAGFLRLYKQSNQWKVEKILSSTDFSTYQFINYVDSEQKVLVYGFIDSQKRICTVTKNSNAFSLSTNQCFNIPNPTYFTENINYYLTKNGQFLFKILESSGQVESFNAYSFDFSNSQATDVDGVFLQEQLLFSLGYGSNNFLYLCGGDSKNLYRYRYVDNPKQFVFIDSVVLPPYLQTFYLDTVRNQVYLGLKNGNNSKQESQNLGNRFVRIIQHRYIGQMKYCRGHWELFIQGVWYSLQIESTSFSTLNLLI